MKKLLLVAYLFLIIVELHSQSQVAHNLFFCDSILKEVNSSLRLKNTTSKTVFVDSALVFKEEFILIYSYTYDSKGNNLSELKSVQSHDSNERYPITLVSQTFDENGNQLTKSEDEFDYQINEWNNVYNSIWTYNDDGYMTSRLDHNEEDGYFDELVTYSYDNNLMKDALSMIRHSENGEWQNFTIIHWVYDNSNIDYTRTIQKWENGTWVNVGKLIYSEDNENKIHSSVTQSWENNSWINHSTIILKLNENDSPLTRVVKNWENNEWVNSSGAVYTYDEYNNLINTITQYWIDNAWVNGWLNDFTYDSDNNLTTYIVQTWGNNDWNNEYKCVNSYSSGVAQSISYVWELNEWVEKQPNYPFFLIVSGEVIYLGEKAKNATIYYRDYTSIDENNSAQGIRLNTYPNPCQDYLEINLVSQNPYKNCIVKIYDLSGKMVKFEEVHNTSDFSIDLSSFPNGTYLVIVLVDEVFLSNKVSILR